MADCRGVGVGYVYYWCIQIRMSTHTAVEQTRRRKGAVQSSAGARGGRTQHLRMYTLAAVECASCGRHASLPQQLSQQAAEPSIGRGWRSVEAAATSIHLVSSRMWWLYARQRYPFPARRGRRPAGPELRASGARGRETGRGSGGGYERLAVSASTVEPRPTDRQADQRVGLVHPSTATAWCAHRQRPTPDCGPY